MSPKYGLSPFVTALKYFIIYLFQKEIKEAVALRRFVLISCTT